LYLLLLDFFCSLCVAAMCLVLHSRSSEGVEWTGGQRKEGRLETGLRGWIGISWKASEAGEKAPGARRGVCGAS
jgi:hypothetical protein